ncbi:MAG TPA: DUF4331 domain-containing protein [Vicinamibacterales bacterium]|nr:DUF4331 domain-containing protein [Vicinamibacterales bacterium]
MKNQLVPIALLALAAGATMIPARASSHREAPLISNDPQADNTDVYAFVSPDAPDSVTLISSWIPFEDPAGGPNFFKFGDNALYEFKIDNNGDGVEDISYQFRFTSQVRNPNTFLYNTGPILSGLDDPNRNLYQTYTVTRVENGQAVATAGPMLTMYDNVGPASTPEYGGHGSGIYAFNQSGGQALVFAGQSDDPFFLDLRVFDLLYGANLSEAGNDSLAGFNVHSIALRVPKSSLRSAASPIIGVWSTASRPTTTTRTAGSETSTGAMVQVSRLGMPLVNEVVIPVGQKDKWNGSKPADDGQFLSYVTDPEVPKLLQAVYNVPAPATPRNDLVQVFLTGVPGLNQPPGGKPSEMLRLNTNILPSAQPSRMGVLSGDLAGFPNGRRLTDDVVDITLQAAIGVLGGVRTSLGDGVDQNDVAFRPSFPYLAPAHSGGNPWKLNPAPVR